MIHAMRYSPLAALLIACPLITAAQVPVFSPGMAKAFRQQFPQVRINASYVVVADFNKDGLPDFATFVGDQENRQEDLPIAVFLARPGGGYALHAESAPISGHERATRDLKVKGRSLFLHRFGSDGCCADWSENYQFQLRDGVFVLIGEESASLPKGDTYGEEHTSINYLSGEVLVWSIHAGKRKERRKSFAMPALVTLASFSDSDHDSAIPQEVHSFVRGQ